MVIEVVMMMESSMVDFEKGGVLRGRTGSVLPGVAPSNVYSSAEGVQIVLAANADAVFRRLCAAMGRAELATDPRFADHGGRGLHMAALDAEIQAWASTLPAEELLTLLSANGVPAGKIYTAADMISDPHYAARDMVLRPDGPQGPTGPMAGIVPKFSRTPGAVRHPGRPLGADTWDVLRELAGVSAREWQRLSAAGLVAQRDEQPVTEGAP